MIKLSQNGNGNKENYDGTTDAQNDCDDDDVDDDGDDDDGDDDTGTDVFFFVLSLSL